MSADAGAAIAGHHFGHRRFPPARADVTSDVPPYATFGGNPARLIRRRYSDEDIKRLLRIAWWNWPIEMITEHVRTIWAGTPAELDRLVEGASLLTPSSSRSGRTGTVAGSRADARVPRRAYGNKS